MVTERTKLQAERSEAWLAFKRHFVTKIRKAAPGAMIGATVIFVACFFIPPLAAISPYALLAGAFLGGTFLKDLSFLLVKTPAQKKAAAEVKQAEKAEAQSPQQARAAAIEQLAAESPPPRALPENHYSQQANAERTAAARSVATATR